MEAKLCAVANLMNNTPLELGFGESCGNSFIEPGQSVDVGNENVLNAPVLQLVENAQPEIRRFSLANPYAQNFLVTLYVEAHNGIGGFPLCAPFPLVSVFFFSAV